MTVLVIAAIKVFVGLKSAFQSLKKMIPAQDYIWEMNAIIIRIVRVDVATMVFVDKTNVIKE